MSLQKVPWVWLDGQLVAWDDAQVPILTHSLHYGLAAFEGIRAYQRADGRTQIFRLREHIRRLFDSAKIATIPMEGFSVEGLEGACAEVVRANALASCYLRPLAFVGDGAMGLHAIHNRTRVAVIAWPWGSYLGDKGIREGIHARVSSFTRYQINASMVKAKIAGQYVNSVLAKREAMADGYDEALLLDTQGCVCEATGENIFVVRDGELMTPPRGSSILTGITRDCILTFARHAGIPTTEQRITRDQVYTADEVFLTGTAAEVTPVRMVDRRPIGDGTPGPITRAMQAKYFDVVKGSDDTYPQWLRFV
jgi:branched-chain amino acid aminotransferase